MTEADEEQEVEESYEPSWPLGEGYVYGTLSEMAIPTADGPCEELDILEALWSEGKEAMGPRADALLREACSAAIENHMEDEGADAGEWTASTLARVVRQLVPSVLMWTGIGVGDEPPTKARLVKPYAGAPLLLHRLAAFLDEIGPESMRTASGVRRWTSVEILLQMSWVELIALGLLADSHSEASLGDLGLPMLPRKGLNTELLTHASYAHLTWVDWLTLTNPELIALGVPKAYATEARQRVIGHERHMSEKWAPSVGLWGGVASSAQIQQVTGASESNVRSYAKSEGLQRRLKGGKQKSQARIAWSLPEGLLRVEQFLYERERDVLFKHLPTDEDGNLQWDDFKEAWEMRYIWIGLPGGWEHLEEEEDPNDRMIRDFIMSRRIT
jgi:hypothetical protein